MDFPSSKAAVRHASSQLESDEFEQIPLFVLELSECENLFLPLKLLYLFFSFKKMLNVIYDHCGEIRNYK